MRSKLASYSSASVLILATVACAARQSTPRKMTLLQPSNCGGVVQLTVSNYTPKDVTLIARTDAAVQDVVGYVPPGVHSYKLQPSSETWYEAHSVDTNDVLARESSPPHLHNPIGPIAFERTCPSGSPA